RTSIGRFATQADVTADNQGGGALDASVAGRVLGVNAVLRHAEYRGGLLDENNSEAELDPPGRRRADVTPHDNVTFGPRVVPLSLRAVRDAYDDGGSTWITQVRGSAALGPVLYSTGFQYDRRTDRLGQLSETFRGFLAGSTFRSYEWKVRA